MLARAHFAVLLLGDRLVAAAMQRGRVEVFVVSAENSVEALRAEIEQRRLPVRTIALALPRASVTVKPIELPALGRSEEHTSELQSLTNLVCRLLLEKKKTK